MSLSSHLKDINNISSTWTLWRKATSLEEITREIRTSVNQGISPSESQSMSFYHARATLLLANWIQEVQMSCISLVWWHPMLAVDGITLQEIPIQDNLSVRDNVFIAFKCLDVYLRQSYAAVSQKGISPWDEFAEYVLKSSRDALSTGLAYHFFVFQTVTEDFSVDLQEISPQKYEARMKSGYKLISQISLLIGHLPLLILDTISTVILKNPFQMNRETDTLSIKGAVLEILRLASQLFMSMEGKKQDTQELFGRLSLLISHYTQDSSGIVDMMQVLEENMDIKSRELRGCPAHNIKHRDQSLFESLFQVSIDAYRQHYQFLIRHKPNTRKNKDRADGKNTPHIFNESTKEVIYSIAKISDFTHF